MDDRKAKVRGQQKPSNDPTTTNTTPVRQLLATANTQTAPAATSTAQVHKRWGVGLVGKRHQQEHRPQQPDKTRRPDAACKGKNG